MRVVKEYSSIYHQLVMATYKVSVVTKQPNYDTCISAPHMPFYVTLTPTVQTTDRYVINIFTAAAEVRCILGPLFSGVMIQQAIVMTKTSKHFLY